MPCRSFHHLRRLQPRHGVVALTLAAWFPAAMAIERGVSDKGVPYASGGMGHSELQDLHARRQSYSFWLTTAAMKSGVHLAGVDVRITPLRDTAPVLDHTTAGPWLFAALPPGRYQVEASFQPSPDRPTQVRRGLTTIHPGDHHQMVLYFDTGDDMGAAPLPGVAGSPPVGPPLAHDGPEAAEDTATAPGRQEAQRPPEGGRVHTGPEGDKRPIRVSDQRSPIGRTWRGAAPT